MHEGLYWQPSKLLAVVITIEIKEAITTMVGVMTIVSPTTITTSIMTEDISATMVGVMTIISSTTTTTSIITEDSSATFIVGLMFIVGPTTQPRRVNHERRHFINNNYGYDSNGAYYKRQFNYAYDKRQFWL